MLKRFPKGHVPLPAFGGMLKFSDDASCASLLLTSLMFFVPILPNDGKSFWSGFEFNFQWFVEEHLVGRVNFLVFQHGLFPNLELQLPSKTNTGLVNLLNLFSVASLRIQDDMDLLVSFGQALVLTQWQHSRQTSWVRGPNQFCSAIPKFWKCLKWWNEHLLQMTTMSLQATFSHWSMAAFKTNKLSERA